MANLIGLKLIKLRAIQTINFMLTNGLLEDAAYYITVFNLQNCYNIPLLIKNLAEIKESSFDAFLAIVKGNRQHQKVQYTQVQRLAICDRLQLRN